MDEPTHYITTAGPASGPYPAKDATDAIPVYVADDPSPVGIAYHVGWEAMGRAVWWLIVHKAPVPGHHVVMDRRFMLVDPDPNDQPPAWRRPKGRG